MKIIVINYVVYYMPDEKYEEIMSEYKADCAKNENDDASYAENCIFKMINKIKLKAQKMGFIDHTFIDEIWI